MKKNIVLLVLVTISFIGCSNKEKPTSSSNEEAFESVNEEAVDLRVPFFKFDKPYIYCCEIRGDNSVMNAYINFTIQPNGNVIGTASNTAAMENQENEFNSFSGDFNGFISYYFEGIKIVGNVEMGSSDSPEVIKERKVYFLLRDFTFIELLTDDEVIIRYKSCE